MRPTQYKKKVEPKKCQTVLNFCSNQKYGQIIENDDYESQSGICFDFQNKREKTDSKTG